MKTLDLLVAEIGSTTTVVTAFDKIESDEPEILGQAEHYTTVLQGDVTLGIKKAISILEKKIKNKIRWKKFLASSSAAGGLKITVHGLVYDMTVKAAKEAALGAGGVIKYITAGKIRNMNLKKIMEISPKLIVLAGGVDYGEENTVLYNAALLADSEINVPIVYAGNCSVSEEIKRILEKKGKEVILTENVYPKVDQLNVKPARKIIQESFSKNIIYAPGMEKVYDIVDDEIIPTPGSVMLTTELLSDIYKDVLVVDIGGATTDIDSVTEGDPLIQKIMLSPEPISKRTVEGDLGLYVNAHNVIDLIGENELRKEFEDYDDLIKNLSPYPQNDRQEMFVSTLAKYCFVESIKRHAGNKKYLYGPNGRQEIAVGKDLTSIKYIFGTGGILSRSKYKYEIMKKILEEDRRNSLIPGQKIFFGYDKNYIFAAIGVLSTVNKEAAINLLKKNIEIIKNR
ncbi:uncharacterized protein (TIGR01319 family) [Oceanotoga teriensis]|uniref:Uncharacterized protein (TIGR01319 family) n=1 Tax=Oceanotoga teriensis TaxID=515440 RepID=A0AA45HJQ3_9BACT|nr:GlmL-related ornithine degradation protein [Oceanotoga teriensis]PWJ96223.1 uncharacterized protein (TIGR01319 family) [Oceanotoga teriensis]